MSKEDKIKLLQDSISEQLAMVVDEAEAQTNSFAQQTVAKNTFRRVRQQILSQLFNHLEVVFPVIPETPASAEPVDSVVETTTETTTESTMKVVVEEKPAPKKKAKKSNKLVEAFKETIKTKKG